NDFLSTDNEFRIGDLVYLGSGIPNTTFSNTYANNTHHFIIPSGGWPSTLELNFTQSRTISSGDYIQFIATISGDFQTEYDYTRDIGTGNITPAVYIQLTESEESSHKYYISQPKYLRSPFTARLRHT